MIEVREVSKRFKNFTALNNVSLDVGEGELVLLLGPNGSGKTTLLRCMMGLISFQGKILIKGYDVKKELKKIRKIMGYLPQTISLYSDMTCTQLLDFFSNLRGVDVYLEDVLEPLGLMDKADTKVGELSGGMRQKLGIALTLLGDPDVILMDEPFSNLDAESKSDAIKLILDLRRRGKTIIISTHTISGLLPISDRIIVLDKGRILKSSRPMEILSIMNPSYKIHVYPKEKINLKVDNVEHHPTGWITITTTDLIGVLRDITGAIEGKIIVEEPSVDELIMRIKGGV